MFQNMISSVMINAYQIKELFYFWCLEETEEFMIKENLWLGKK
jgi:hypothetical protein